LLRLLLCVSGFVTVTVTAPAACAGVVAVICVGLTTRFVAAMPPNVTAAPATKFVPVIVIPVPPTAGPVVGVTLLAVGGGDTLAALNVAICMIQAVLGETGAVAL
jgi:hypothetical protein